MGLFCGKPIAGAAVQTTKGHTLHVEWEGRYTGYLLKDLKGWSWELDGTSVHTSSLDVGKPIWTKENWRSSRIAEVFQIFAKLIG